MLPLRSALASTLAVLGVAMLLTAQSRRTYPTAQVWWEPGRGLIFPASEDYDDTDGLLTVFNASGAVRPEGHPFFEALGTNGRACITCHQPANAMSLSASSAQMRWQATHGTDPLFAAIDGSNCPSLPQAEAASHSLLLQRGLIRIFMAWPPAKVKPDFDLKVVRDPTGCNTASTVSVFRRPRMTANLKYGPAAHLMADGREPSLASQAVTAALVHEQAAAHPAAEQLQQIVDFENQVFAAQSADDRAGLFNEPDGPAVLGVARLAEGKAALLRGEATPFSAFAKWSLNGPPSTVQADYRMSVARGSQVFAERCSNCHSSSKSEVMAMNIGTTMADDPQLPRFEMVCHADGSTLYTQDPGRALITGRCADAGAVVMQQLRGLSARAPYFSNGSAATLRDVVAFYEKRFQTPYTERQKQDLVNFLRSL